MCAVAEPLVLVTRVSPEKGRVSREDAIVSEAGSEIHMACRIPRPVYRGGGTSSPQGANEINLNDHPLSVRQPLFDTCLTAHIVAALGEEKHLSVVSRSSEVVRCGALPQISP
jgi:hypothetical protein